MWTHGCIGDVLSLIQNGVNCKQDKSGVGDKVSRIETIADSNINYEKTGFAVLDEKQKAKSMLHEGDILFSHINSPVHVGKTAIYDGVEPLYHGINLLRIQTIDAVDSRYFNMYLISLFQSGYWKRTSKQSVNQASVNQTDIKLVPFSYPPLAEQQRIVAKLDAAFAEIDRARELNDKRSSELKNLIAKSQKQLFLSISETASVMKLGDVAKFENGDRGKNYPSKKYQIDEGIPFVNAGDFSLDGDIETQSMVYISEERFNLLGAGKFKIDDVLFCLRGSLGKSAIIKSIEIGAIASSLVILRAKQNIVSSDYLFAYIRSDIVKNLIAQTAGGAAQPNLSAKVVSNYEIPVPPLEEQQRLTEKFWLIREKGLVALDRILQKSQHLIQLKAAVLAQELQPPQSEAA